MKKPIFIICFLINALLVFPQRENVNKALRYYQQYQTSTQQSSLDSAQRALDSARLYIDLSANHAQTSLDAVTWYYRGYIYKDLYNQKEKNNKVSELRIISLTSFNKYIELDTVGKFKDNVLQNIKYIATTFYNDAATSLTIDSYSLAIKCYDKYKEITRSLEPGKDFSELDIQLYNALGSIYMQIYELDREKNKEFFNNSRNAYLFVLDKDSNNYNANYNIGILFYNDAVSIIKSLDYDLDLITLELIQDQCVEIFKKSLPYMQKAYTLNPRRKETLIGLSGIYFSLNELEKSNELQRQLELLDKQ